MKKLLHRPVQEFFRGDLGLLRIRLSLVARFESACKTMAASLFRGALEHLRIRLSLAARFGTAVETVVASRFFRGALTQLPIRILREPGVEVTDEIGKLPPHISAVLNSASHHIGSPCKGSRLLCRRGVE